MELKTEMEGGCVHALGYCVDENNVHPKAAEHLQHDAAYAHALNRALLQCFGSERERLWIMAKAEDLMREWGFEERARS